MSHALNEWKILSKRFSSKPPVKAGLGMGWSWERRWQGRAEGKRGCLLSKMGVYTGLTAFQLHDARLYVHGEVLQVHGAGQSQRDPGERREHRECQTVGTAEG